MSIDTLDLRVANLSQKDGCFNIIMESEDNLKEFTNLVGQDDTFEHYYSGRYSFPMVVNGRLCLTQDNSVGVSLSHDMFDEEGYNDEHVFDTFSEFEVEYNSLSNLSYALKKVSYK